MNDKILCFTRRLVKKHKTRDPFKLAGILGYEIIYINSKKQKGFCKIFLNNCYIFINENMSLEMQRMTCAHELGHLFLHKDILRKDLALAEMEIFDITDRRELEANQFAASFLLSDEDILNILEDGHDIVTAASILNVNVNMLMIKLLAMNQDGYDFDLPFSPKAAFMGTIEDRADSL